MANAPGSETRGVLKEAVMSIARKLQIPNVASDAPIEVHIHKTEAPDDLLDGNKHPACKLIRKAVRAKEMPGRRSGPSLWVRRSDVLALVGGVSEESGRVLVEAPASARDAVVARIAGRSR